jgi:hypothetical protein
MVPRIRRVPVFRFASCVYVTTGHALPELKKYTPLDLERIALNCPRPTLSLLPANLAHATWEWVESIADGDARMRTLIFLGIVRALKRIDQNFLIPGNNHAVLGLYFPADGGAPRPLLILSASRSGARVQHFHAQFRREDRWSQWATELTDAMTGLKARLCTWPHLRISNDEAPFGGLVSLAMFVSNRALHRAVVPEEERQAARVALLASCEIFQRRAVLISQCAIADQNQNADLRDQISRDIAELAAFDAAPEITKADEKRRKELKAKNKTDKTLLHRNGLLPDGATVDLMALVVAKLRSLQRSATVRSAGRDDVEQIDPAAPVPNVELAAFLARVNAGTFWDNVEYLMQDFCIVDSSAGGVQVPSARFIVQLDLDQWMSKFGLPDEADDGPAVAAATDASLGIFIQQVCNASGASRPKSAAAVGIPKKQPVVKLGSLQLANQGDCPCNVFLTSAIFDDGGHPVHAGVTSNDGMVQTCKEVSLKVERVFWQTGDNKTAPLAAYARTRLMHSSADQNNVIGPGRGRIPGNKFIPNLAAEIRQRYPSFTPCVELYNCKTLENFSTPSHVGALAFNARPLPFVSILTRSCYFSHFWTCRADFRVRLCRRLAANALVDASSDCDSCLARQSVFAQIAHLAEHAGGPMPSVWRKLSRRGDCDRSRIHVPVGGWERKPAHGNAQARHYRPEQFHDPGSAARLVRARRQVL